MDNKILKTKLVDWKSLKLFQPEDLKEMSKNQLNKIKTSFRKNGFKAPFYVWEDKNVIWCLDGHTRIPILRLLESEGETVPEKLPANFIDCKNKADAKKAVMIYNSHYADINRDVFMDWIGDLDIDELMDEIDIHGIDFNLIEKKTINDDEIPDRVESITKINDIWELGQHRLLCGDSNEITAVERLMDGKKANMVFTDPPYNVDYQGAAGKIKNDKFKKNETFYQFLHDAISTMRIFVLGDVYICMSSSELHTLQKAFMDCGGHWSTFIIWVKNTFTLGRSNYQRQYEPILYGWFEGSSHYWSGARNLGDVVKQEDAFHDGLDVYLKVSNLSMDVWEYPKPNKNKIHPTMKPVELVTRAVKNSSKNNDIVLDTFMGSGTTLITCEKTNRICYGVELDTHFCDVIVNRYHKWCGDNGIKAEIKLNGKKYSLDA